MKLQAKIAKAVAKISMDTAKRACGILQKELAARLPAIVCIRQRNPRLFRKS